MNAKFGFDSVVCINFVNVKGLSEGGNYEVSASVKWSSRGRTLNG